MGPLQNLNLDGEEILVEAESLQEKPESTEKAVPGPPRDVDEGWAWVVAVAVFTVHFICLGLAFSTGVYHVLFLKAFGASHIVTSWAGALLPAVLFGTGPLASMLVNRLGPRRVMLLGALISSGGITASSFVPSIAWMYLTFGFLPGLGFSLCYLGSLSGLAFYFDRRLRLVTGLTTTGVGLGTTVMPIFIRFLSDCLGWRGSLFVLGGATLNLCACAMVVRPIQRPDLRQTPKKDYFDLTVFRKINMWMISANSGIVCFGLSITYVHLAAYAETAGLGLDRSALLITALGISNLAGRLVLGMLASWQRVDILVLHLVTFALAGVAVTLVAATSAFVWLLILSLVIGFLVAGLGTLLVPITVQALGLSRFISGYGVLSLVSGVGQISGAPIAGLLYDQTQSYTASFMVGGISLIVSSVFMIIPLVYKKHCCLPSPLPRSLASILSNRHVADVTAPSQEPSCGKTLINGRNDLEGAQRKW